jgi:hypothetical protein
VPLPAKQVTRDRILSDGELARIILAARQIGGPYGDIVEVLALTGQRREEVARCTWDEIDVKGQTWKLSADRTKNAKSHKVHLSDPVMEVLNRANKGSKFIFSRGLQGNGHLGHYTLKRRRFADRISLGIINANFTQGLENLVAFDKFGNGALAHHFCYVNDHFDHGSVDLAIQHFLYEAAINLDDVNREMLQVRERRHTGAEVVKREAAAQLL